MAEIVKMPKLSDTMTEGVVAKWHKKVGDPVKEGDLLAEIETDKATMEFESFQEGTLLYQGVEEGKATAVDSVLAILGKKGEDYKSLLESENGKDNSTSDDAEDATSVEEKKKSQKSEALNEPDVNANIIRMPKLSDTMTEGTVAKWHKKKGDKVASGDLLAEIETDKATMEFESYEDGTLLYIGVEEGKSAPVDSILVIVGEKGADYQSLIDYEESRASQSEEAESEKKDEKQETVSSQPGKKSMPQSDSTNGRIKASPLAKKMAEERRIPLSIVSGTGDDGRIIKRDIENFTGGGVSAVSTVEGHTDRDISQMRKTIARRLSESKFQAPHFYLTISLDMDRAVEARKAINNKIEGKISFNDLVIKAAAIALKEHPDINAAWNGDTVRYFDHTHIGVAVAVEEGLLVPVVKHANAKSFEQIGAEVKQFAEKAKNKTLQPNDWEGSTFTVSNLGMFDIEEFTAIINPPNACILAVGAIMQKPVVKEGQVVPGNVMKVTLSCDHRVVDGVKGANFLRTFRRYIEDPITMFV